MSTARVAVAVALVGFWGLVAVGGALEPGYSHVEDYVSRLASFGARVPGVGIGAIAALATAHAAGAVVLHRLRARPAAVALGAAATSGYVVAAFRIHCPGGAAGCVGAGDEEPWTDTVHAVGVVSYEVFLLVAVVASAAWAGRRGRTALGLLWLALALASVVAVGRVHEPAAGADQRLWLAVSTVWLLTVAGLAECRQHRAGAR